MFLVLGDQRVVNLDHIVSMDVDVMGDTSILKFFEAGMGEEGYFHYKYDTPHGARRALETLLDSIPHLELLTE